MALSSPIVACLLLVMLGLYHVDSRSVSIDHSIIAKKRSVLGVTIDCGAACAVRCSKSWKPKMCKKMCGVCCNKCNCVPPGTSVETRITCACYASMTTPSGKLKCP
ncbi:snakin-2-like [Zingiber officinale]|uniref:Uncharacterized protein n=1 Tax=Zingiber officinale TaxID=94328 RepID=A0A8J5F4T8_ZINOF|nr:snakin-2-like [Zingiber officinale]KAG6478472.1 hypothetical protein ZIOFF_061915 [Zingiber officinale]